MSDAPPLPHPAPAERERTIALALVSHTNVGKTALARTLTGRDVGEVRDAPHVTEFSDGHVLVETDAGERLVLWDTPGFGDSVRLAKRLRGQANPIARFLAELWDRWRDRPLWASQQALRTVRDEADALLYLVNASERIEAAGYVRPEMEVLAWTGKPVIALLNQLGTPRAPADEAGGIEPWQTALAAWPAVHAVLPLDAFGRVWIEELALLDAIEAALPAARRPLMARLAAAWRGRRRATFDASMRTLADMLVRVATAAVPVAPPERWRDRIASAGAAIAGRYAKGGKGGVDADAASAEAWRALAAALEDEQREATRALIGLHGLGGDAEREILQRLAGGVELRQRVDETQAAAWGGVVTGALTGLKADILSGGLTLGGGLVAGGLLGALGGAGLARAANLVRGTDRSHAAWTVGALDAVAEAAALRYLAVAHYGRGRGDWTRGEPAPHWPPAVAAAFAARRDAWHAAWALRGAPKPDDAPAVREAAQAALREAIAPLLADSVEAVLEALHPRARGPSGSVSATGSAPASATASACAAASPSAPAPREPPPPSVGAG